MNGSRRQVLGKLTAAFGAILVGASALGPFLSRKKRPGAKYDGPRRGKNGALSTRVRPAPFTVKRHG